MHEAVSVDPGAAEAKVVQALENPKYVWRTLDGIVKETGLSTGDISVVLKMLPDDVRVVSRNGKGDRVYTTRRHYRERQSIASKFLSILADRAI